MAAKPHSAPARTRRGRRRRPVLVPGRLAKAGGARGVDETWSLREAWHHAATVAEQPAQQTARLAAKLGRACSHGDKSIGTPNAGVVSIALGCTAMSAELERAASTEGGGWPWRGSSSAPA